MCTTDRHILLNIILEFTVDIYAREIYILFLLYLKPLSVIYSTYFIVRCLTFMWSPSSPFHHFNLKISSHRKLTFQLFWRKKKITIIQINSLIRLARYIVSGQFMQLAREIVSGMFMQIARQIVSGLFMQLAR